MAFVSGDHGNNGNILRGTGEHRQYWGTGNIRKHILWNMGSVQAILFFSGTREQDAPPCKGLAKKQINKGTHMQSLTKKERTNELYITRPGPISQELTSIEPPP